MRATQHIERRKAKHAGRVHHHKGHPESAATREKISERLKGRKLSQSHKENISKARTGQPRGPYRKKPKS